MVLSEKKKAIPQKWKTTEVEPIAFLSLPSWKNSQGSEDEWRQDPSGGY